MRPNVKWFAIASILGLVVLLAQCESDQNTGGDTQVYLNHNDTVKYVGINTCKQCHYEIYKTFIETGMGSSFGVADTAKSDAGLHENSLLYDEFQNFNYHPFWNGDSLYLKEFRLSQNDTVYKNSQKIDYVVGSGQHTNSHMYVSNEYLYQAPFTWYSQKQKLDFPPGYEDGHNKRFSRKIGLECTSCHNAMPVHFEVGSINKYRKIPSAIDCERCHGPGEAHVNKIQKGLITDTANETDYSIVNIKKLSTELQFETCMRCHLQGNAVLAQGKDYMDFKPGMKLSEVMDVYLPRYKNAEDEFIMASHVDRFKQSKCFIQSERTFNCTSCHNPHVSVKQTFSKQFNSTCQKCHSGAPMHQCKYDEDSVALKNYNCVSCHMPQSGSIDIPHVSVHDHKIQIPVKRKITDELKEFLGLESINNNKPSKRSKALAYLQQYERFENKNYYLDSAKYFLNQLELNKEGYQLWIHYNYLKKDHLSTTELVERLGSTLKLDKENYGNTDAWTAYRIGQAYNAKPERALYYFTIATDLAPFISEFRLQKAISLIKIGEQEKGMGEYKKLLNEEPNNAKALNNLGYEYLKNGDLENALLSLRRALDEDPDYELAWLNLANYHLIKEEYKKALKCIDEVLRINPQNRKANQAKVYLSES